jgi:predicted RNase H-like HicB family nuclease
MTKNLNYYARLPYSFKIEWSDLDTCYIATVEEIPECQSHGNAPDEALCMIKDALISHISCCLHFGDTIPEPVKIVDYKGKIHFRTTPQKHYMLDKQAKIAGESINAIINTAIDRYFNINTAQA